MYHYVGDGRAAPLDAIRGLSREAFEQQIDRLLSRFDPATGPSLRTAARAGGSPARVVFTFDDGLADHVEVAAPLLEGRGARGVFLISGRPFVEKRMVPAHMVHILLCYLGPADLARAVRRWLAKHAPDGRWHERFDRQAAHAMYHYETAETAELKYLLNVALPMPLRDRLLQALFSDRVGAQREWVRRWYATIEQWRDMQARGHVIGGHGYTHEPLVSLGRAASEDIERSAAFLREMFGDRPRPFSYPFGSHDAAVTRACRDAGFTAAYTTITGWNDERTDPFRLHRVDTIAVENFLGSHER